MLARLPIPSSVFGAREVQFALFDESGVPVELDGNFDPVLDPILYVQLSDAMQLLKWGEQHATTILSDEGISLVDRTSFCFRGLLLEASRIYQHRARFMRTQEFIRSTSVAARFFTAHLEVLAPTLQFARAFDSPVSRAANTGLVASCLVTAIGQPELAGRALLAGLIADIGIVDSHRKLIALDRALTPPERNIINAHPVSSARLLNRVGIHDAVVIDAVMFHHERLDGSGYPSRLAGADIPRLAQVVGLANAFVGLTSPRGKRPPETDAGAVQQLFAESFDDDLVAVLRTLVQTPQAFAA
jgi:HD domain-containing protein